MRFPFDGFDVDVPVWDVGWIGRVACDTLERAREYDFRREVDICHLWISISPPHQRENEAADEPQGEGRGLGKTGHVVEAEASYDRVACETRTAGMEYAEL